MTNIDDQDVRPFWDRLTSPCPSTLYILGIKYNTNTDGDDIQNDILSRVWFTYRYGFEPIQGDKRLTFDTGWGCMHRSGQMMLAESLIRMHHDRDWRWDPLSHDDQYWSILKRFQDRSSAHYSIHNITSHDCSEDKYLAQWLGPNTVARVLKKLSRFDASTSPRIHVTNENGIIIDEIIKFCKAETQKEPETQENIISTQQSHGSSDRSNAHRSITPNSRIQTSIANSVDSGSDIELLDMTEEEKCAFYKPWDADIIPLPDSKISDCWHPLLLMVPLRLGLNGINSCYFESIKAIFQIPYTVGILTGRPNKAQWSIGVIGDYLISLDPHFPQPAAVFTTKIPKPTEDSTFHCRQPICTKISDLDPCLAVGFYCATESEFQDLCHQLRTEVMPKGTEAFVEVNDTRPRPDAFPSNLVLPFDDLDDCSEPDAKYPSRDCDMIFPEGDNSGTTSDEAWLSP